MRIAAILFQLHYKYFDKNSKKIYPPPQIENWLVKKRMESPFKLKFIY